VKLGIFAQLSSLAKLLYCFLCIVANREGVSYYGDYRLTMELKLSGTELRHARDELCRCDLIAFDGKYYQVLSLPAATTPKGHPPPEQGEQGPQWLGDILGRIGFGGKE